MLKFKGLIHGPINPEDLTVVPDSKWVVTSGMMGPTVPSGHVYAIDIDTHAAVEIYPYCSTVEHDAATYGDLEPLDPHHFEPHGIDVGRGPNGELLLYVVHHGVRESIEVFRIDNLPNRPKLTWVGAVRMPDGTWGNDVAAKPGGGFLVTNTADISEGAEAGFAKSLAGEPNGWVVEWTIGSGWTVVPGSRMCSTNGVVRSSDGQRVLIGGWVPKCVVRLEFGAGDPKVDTVDVPVLTDNLTWTRDGKVLLTGAYDTTVPDFAGQFYGGNPTCTFPTHVIEMDPDTLQWKILASYDGATFGPGTTALQVRDEIWVGSMRYEGIARFG